jgi:hypothetical protein
MQYERRLRLDRGRVTRHIQRQEDKTKNKTKSRKNKTKAERDTKTKQRQDEDKDVMTQTRYKEEKTRLHKTSFGLEPFPPTFLLLSNAA